MLKGLKKKALPTAAGGKVKRQRIEIGKHIIIFFAALLFLSEI
jgi:hypothetical protein